MLMDLEIILYIYLHDLNLTRMQKPHTVLPQHI